jgi:integrase
LSHYLGGRRHRQTFSDLEQAKNEATAKAAQLARGDLDAASDIQIFTPDELRRLLAASPTRVATCIALQAFAGIRTAELFRLTWRDLERNGHIEISAGKAKTSSRRLIPICDTLAAWIRQAARHGERVWPVTASEYYSQQARAASVAGIKWKANALRRSFISYRLAQIKDVGEVALEAGNSPTIIFQHYRELATPAEAQEWFGILPDKRADNVVPFAA